MLAPKSAEKLEMWCSGLAGCFWLVSEGDSAVLTSDLWKAGCGGVGGMTWSDTPANLTRVLSV